MTNPKAPEMLFVMDQAPYGGGSCGELLDMILSAAAFDLPCALLIQGDAVTLAGGATPSSAEHKSLREQLEALPIFGITEIHLNGADCAARAITPSLNGARTISEDGIRALYQRHQQVVQL